MAQTQNTFEGGTNGATITTSNSGGASGTAWDFIEILAGATATYTTTASNGSRAASFTGNGAHAYLQWYITSTTKMSLRAYVRLPALPSAEFQAITPRSTTDYIGSVNFTTAGKIKLTSAAPGTPTLFTATTALSVNTWYRVEVSWEVGTTTANGKVQFKYFLGDGTTAIESFTSTTANLGTSPIVDLRLGKINNTGNTPIMIDSVTYDPATVALLGPHTGITIAPTANAGTGGTDVEPGVTCTLNGSGSTDSDGTIASYVWTQTSGTSVTIAGSGHTRTFKAPYTIAGTTLVFRLTVTDNDGLTATASVSFSVLRCTERALIGGVMRPVAIYIATP